MDRLTFSVPILHRRERDLPDWSTHLPRYFSSYCFLRCVPRTCTIGSALSLPLFEQRERRVGAKTGSRPHWIGEEEALACFRQNGKIENLLASCFFSPFDHSEVGSKSLIKILTRERHRFTLLALFLRPAPRAGKSWHTQTRLHWSLVLWCPLS